MDEKLSIPDEVKQHPAWLRLEDQSEWYEKKSAHNQQRYKGLKLVQIVLAASIPIIALIDVPHTKLVVAIFGALIAIFDPRGITLEEYDGLSPSVDVDDPEKMRVPFEKVVPIIPSWATAFDIETIRKIIMGELPASAISIGAGLAATLAANESANIILQKRKGVSYRLLNYWTIRK